MPNFLQCFSRVFDAVVEELGDKDKDKDKDDPRHLFFLSEMPHPSTSVDTRTFLRSLIVRLIHKIVDEIEDILQERHG